MIEHIIRIPKEFTSENVDPVFLQVQEISKKLDSSKEYQIVFDISDTKYLSVVAVLIIVRIADDFFQKDCKCVVRHIKPKESVARYLMRSLGAIAGTQDEQFEEYIRNNVVQVQTCNNLGQCSEAVDKKIIPLIKNKYGTSDEILKAINWILWETIDNAIAHGYLHEGKESDFPRPIYACAYAYENFIDIAILDSGQGIKNSLVSSGEAKYQGIDDAMALRLAIKKGESGRKGGSTGYGLFGCSEIAKQADGELSLVSGEKRLYSSENGIKITNCLDFKGTLVQLTIPGNVTMDLAKMLGKEIDITPSDFGWLTGTVS